MRSTPYFLAGATIWSTSAAFTRSAGNRSLVQLPREPLGALEVVVGRDAELQPVSPGSRRWRWSPRLPTPPVPMTRTHRASILHRSIAAGQREAAGVVTTGLCGRSAADGRDPPVTSGRGDRLWRSRAPSREGAPDADVTAHAHSCTIAAGFAQGPYGTSAQNRRAPRAKWSRRPPPVSDVELTSEHAQAGPPRATRRAGRGGTDSPYGVSPPAPH
jgi:hypothetical protein